MSSHLFQINETTTVASWTQLLNTLVSLNKLCLSVFHRRDENKSEFFCLNYPKISIKALFAFFCAPAHTYDSRAILCLEFVVFGTVGPCCWNLSPWQVFRVYYMKRMKRIWNSGSCLSGEKVSSSRRLMANNSAPMGHMHIVCLLAVVVLLYVQKGRKKKTLIGISTTWWGYISADIFLLVYSFWYGSLSPCFLISHLAVYG